MEEESWHDRDYSEGVRRRSNGARQVTGALGTSRKELLSLRSL